MVTLVTRTVYCGLSRPEAGSRGNNCSRGRAPSGPDRARRLEHEAAVGTNGPGSAAPLRGRSTSPQPGQATTPSQFLRRLRSQIAAKAAGEIVRFGRRRPNRAVGEPRRDQVLSWRAPASGITLAGRLDLERLPALQTAGHVTGLIGQQDAVNTARFTFDMAHRQSLGARLYDNRKTGIAPCQSGGTSPIHRAASASAPYSPPLLQVTRTYSELQPRNVPGGYCDPFISRTFPQAEVTWSFEYGATVESRAAGVEALRRAGENLRR